MTLLQALGYGFLAATFIVFFCTIAIAPVVVITERYGIVAGMITAFIVLALIMSLYIKMFAGV